MNRTTRSMIRMLASLAVITASLAATAQPSSTFLNVPNYSQEATTWCGAAAAQMIVAGYPPTATACPKTQAQMWAAIQANKVEPAWDTDPRGLAKAMMSECALPTGGQWTVVDRANANDLMYAVAYWMKRNNFPVAILLSTVPHNSVAAHREKWAVVKGIVTSADPTTTSNVTLNYIQFVEQPQNLIDPPVEQFMSGSAFYAQFQPVTITGSQYINNYVAVIEPPVRRGIAVATALPITGTIQTAARIRAAALSRIQNSGATRLNAFRPLLRMTPGTPLLVNRDRGGYYLVPFSDRGRLATMAATFNAYNGEFMEVVRLTGRPLLQESEAVERARQFTGRRAGQATASLVSESGGSRYAPEWRVVVDGNEVTVDQTGSVRRRGGSEQRGNCEVRVNGSVVLRVQATDREDCYRKTSFGSQNCARYAQYFRPGTNLLEQYFNGTDRVNSDRCTR